MVARLSYVVAASLIAYSCGFSTTNVPLSSTKRVAFGGGHAVAVVRAARALPRFGLRMSSDGSKESASAREIDFSKVGFNDGSESGFSGMIFRPEDSEEPESRCRVDWDVRCEKVTVLNEKSYFDFPALTHTYSGAQ